jgi:alpha-L-fucosidase
MKRSLFKTILIISLIFLVFPSAFSQESHGRYAPETDTLVLKKIKEWQDLKFGLLMHWGPYSQWGIVESWSICPEEYGWCRRYMGSDPDNYNTYLKEYEDLKLTFNPTRFNPEKWAEAAKEAGMKYVIFTTKHHDGFCMFDTKYTDYKITDKACPFHKNPKANVTKEIFKAFREKGFWTGAYFSKPDWHSPYFWWPKYPPIDRNVNYNPDTNPEVWQKFVEFTHNQVMELVNGDYGKVDILWFDGGWVQKKEKKYMKRYYASQVELTPGGYVMTREVNMDIKMDELVEKVRKAQPGILVVDRAVHGKNQNYLTPENKVPLRALPYPWESCIISGGGWSYTPDAHYKSGHEAIQLLVDIISKGGNLLLNIAPSPTGEWQQGAYDLLKEYADWMKVNAEAIYGTKTMAPYKVDNICMTQKDDGTVYYYYMAEKNESKLPAEIVINVKKPSKNKKIVLLGTDRDLVWKSNGKESFKIMIPEELRENPPAKYVWVFKVS